MTGLTTPRTRAPLTAVPERAIASLSVQHVLGGYREYAPPPPLAHFSEAVWVYQTPRDVALGGATHRVLPDPALSVAFCCSREPGGGVVGPRLLLVGPKTRPHLCTFERGYEMAAVRVKLEWVAAVLGLVPTDHHDALDDLSLISPRAAGWLLDALVETRTPEQAVTTLAAALGGLAARAPARHRPAASQALDLVRRTSGRLTVEEVAARMSVSVRHLRRTVQREAGVSLKAYARTLRLLRAVTTADCAPEPVWARVAADSGFCDQSHLVRECRALCGMPPSQVYRERRAEAEISNRR